MLWGSRDGLELYRKRRARVSDSRHGEQSVWKEHWCVGNKEVYDISRIPLSSGSSFSLYKPSIPMEHSWWILIWRREGRLSQPIWRSPCHVLLWKHLHVPIAMAFMGFPLILHQSKRPSALGCLLCEWNQGVCYVAPLQLPRLHSCSAPLNSPWGITDVSPYHKVLDLFPASPASLWKNTCASCCSGVILKTLTYARPLVIRLPLGITHLPVKGF